MSGTGGAKSLVIGLVAVVVVALGFLLLRDDAGHTGPAGGSAPAVDAPKGPDDAPSFHEGTPVTPAGPKLLVEGQGGPQAVQPIVPGASVGEVGSLLVRGHLAWNAKGLADVDVMLYDNEGTDLDVVSTDADGHFEIESAEPLLPGWSVGTDPVEVTFNGEPVSLCPVLAGPFPAWFPGDPAREVELLPGYAPAVTGRVSDRATNEPVANAEIYAGSILPAWELDEADAVSGEDGTFVLRLDELPLQGLVVWCLADEYQAMAWGPHDVAAASVPGEGLRIDFALEQPQPWKGLVTDAASGQPVADATITVGSDLPMFRDWSDFEISDEDGSFELELPEIPPTVAWVHVIADEYGPTWLRHADPGRRLDLRLGRPLTLAGKVVDWKSGKPIEAADVIVAFDGESNYLEEGLYDEGWSEADGSFSLLLENAPVGAARLQVDATGYASFEMPLEALVQPGKTAADPVLVRMVPSP